MLCCLACAAATPASPTYKIKCAYADQSPTFASVYALWLKLFNSSVPPTSYDPTDCFRGKSLNILEGPSDIIVVVDQADYDAAIADAKGKPMRLFLNGFDMGAQGALLSHDRNQTMDNVALRFSVGARHEGAQAFWSAVYQDHGLLDLAPLQAGVGWQSEPAFDGPLDFGEPLFVSVTG